MASALPSSPSQTSSPADVADRVRSLQLGTAERKTAEFGLRGYVWLIVVSLIGAGVWWGIQQQGNMKAAVGQLLPGGKAKFELVPVKVEGGEEVLLDVTGYITPKHKVNVSARVPGMLASLYFEEGDRVQAGQVLAELDDAMFQADYEQAKAAELAAESRLMEMKNGALPEELDQAETALEQAKNKLVLAEREHERAKKLRKDISDAEWDQMQSTLSDAEANVKTLEQKLKLLQGGPRAERIQAVEAEVAQAKALVSKAKTNLDNSTLVSPISGVVLERRGEVGENIRPEGLSPGIFTIADMTLLEVQVDVEEQNLGKLRVGQPCRVIPDAYADRSYAAKISRWQQQVNRARAVVRVILTIDEPDDSLLAEMNCRAVILATQDNPQPETLWIPAKAVVTAENQASVFVVADGVARQRTVQLGTVRDNLVQVTSGLTKTDRVILSSNRPPADGQKVL